MRRERAEGAAVSPTPRATRRLSPTGDLATVCFGESGRGVRGRSGGGAGREPAG